MSFKESGVTQLYITKTGLLGSSFWTQGEMNKALHSFCIIHHIGVYTYVLLGTFQTTGNQVALLQSERDHDGLFLGKVDQLYRV